MKLKLYAAAVLIPIAGLVSCGGNTDKEVVDKSIIPAGSDTTPAQTAVPNATTPGQVTIPGTTAPAGTTGNAGCCKSAGKCIAAANHYHELTE
ncbi:MAG: hypothetical protein IPI88_14295 [Chitinophagaceae bacterium]|nr:hypothetical protein [Chitinophagaceae bacterium]